MIYDILSQGIASFSYTSVRSTVKYPANKIVLNMTSLSFRIWWLPFRLGIRVVTIEGWPVRKDRKLHLSAFDSLTFGREKFTFASYVLPPFLHPCLLSVINPSWFVSSAHIVHARGRLLPAMFKRALLFFILFSYEQSDFCSLVQSNHQFPLILLLLSVINMCFLLRFYGWSFSRKYSYFTSFS